MIYSMRQRYGGTYLLFILLQLSGTVAQRPRTIDYALQVRPVTFLQEPTSRVALVGSSVTFSCNTSIAPLISNYPLPTLTWRFNGSANTQSSWKVTTNSGDDGYSELHIENVTEGNAGYYECVSSDGGGNYITVSRRAWLTVVKVRSVLDVQSWQLVAESPLLLPCDVGTSASPEQAQWFRDGVQLSRDDLKGGWDILRNGSLLVFSASSEDTGSYYCTGWITGTPLNSSIFEITVTAGVGNFQLLVDPDRAQPTAGESLNLTCYFIGRWNGTEGPMRWLKNREVLVATNVTESGSRRAVLQLNGLASSHSGFYTCEMMVDGVILQASAHVTVTVPPTIAGEHVRPDVSVRRFSDRSVVLSCAVSGSPAPTVRWYRNGQDITHLLSNGMTYTVSDGNINGLLGIYQCFAVNSAGVAYNILRVLEYAFANPPGNLTCTLALRNTFLGYTGPRIVLNWVPPVLSPFVPPSSYEIQLYRFQNNTYPETFDGPHADLNFEDYPQGVYSLRVRVNRDELDSLLPLSTSCNIDTSRFDSVENTEWPLSGVTCKDTNIAVKWLNPTFPFEDDYVEKLHLSATCLYGNKTDLKFTSTYIDEDNENRLIYDLTSHISVPSGAVCLFGGDFRIDKDSVRTSRIIPSEQCSLPATQGLNKTVLLGLSCQRSVATISWFTSPSKCYRLQNLTLQGKCLDRAWPWTEFQYSVLNTTDPAGIITVDEIPNGGICTFYGYYQDSDGETRTIDPVQCVIGQDVDPVYSLMQDAANYTYNDSDCIPPMPEPSTELPTTTSAPTSNSSFIAPLTTTYPPSPSILSTPGTSSPTQPGGIKGTIPAPTSDSSFIAPLTTAYPPSPSILSPPATSSPTQPGGIEGYWWAVLGAVSVVAVFVFIVTMLLLAIVYHNRRLIHKEEEERLRMAQLVREHCEEDPHEPNILMELRYYEGLDAASVITDWENLCRSQNSMIVTEKSISSLVEDGKPHLMSKFLQSQPTTPAAWKDSDTNINDNQERDPHRLQPHEQATEDSSLLVSCVPGSPEHVSITDDERVAGYPFVSYSHSGGTSSSGYGTESYYASDASFSYNTSEGPISLYQCKLDTVEEGLDATELRTDMLATDPNNVNSKHVNKRVRILSPDLKIDTDTREVCEGVSENSEQEIHCEQIEDTSSLFTGDSITKMGHQKKDSEIKQSVSLVASSPLSEMSEDCSRSPHQSAYNTDDEGYVHMDCALPPVTMK